ncbi:uncharacterized protein LOC143021907 [Oratosquilla oratoria]|uniref:uncharacterized protein LOC143021907 n=1 Tax=Oratosquilla oratoria TaxID=337810 RepID=UPI003F76D7E2
MKTLLALALLVAVVTSLPAKPSKKTFPKKFNPDIHKIEEDTYTTYTGDVVLELVPPEPFPYTHFEGPAVYPLLPPGSSYSEVNSRPLLALQPPRATVIPEGVPAEESSYTSFVKVPSVELTPPGSSYSEGTESQKPSVELTPPGSSYSEGTESQNPSVELTPPGSSYSEGIESQKPSVELTPPGSSYSEGTGSQKPSVELTPPGSSYSEGTESQKPSVELTPPGSSYSEGTESQKPSVELTPPGSSYSKVGVAHGEHVLTHLASMVRALPVILDSSYVDYTPQAKGDPAILEGLTTALVPPPVDSYSYVPSQNTGELTTEEKEALEAAGVPVPSSVLLPPPEI